MEYEHKVNILANLPKHTCYGQVNKNTTSGSGRQENHQEISFTIDYCIFCL